MLSRLERLLAELKRRHVFRMVGVYALGAWVVIQVATTTAPYVGIPQGVVTALIVAAAGGLVLTIVLAWAFDLTSEGIRRAEDGAPAVPGMARSRWRRLGIPLLVLAVFTTAAGIATRAVRDRAPALDESLAAVLPFRVSGGGASTEGLGEGMVDLLALRLGGDPGIRAVDPRAVMSRWRRWGGADAEDAGAVAGRIARALGAARFITGSMVVAGGGVTIGANLRRTGVLAGSGRTESVTGPVDSLLYLVDRLAVALLAGDAGLETQQLGGLTSLPALEAYLAGKAAHRRGEYAVAVRAFQKALDADSAFALAALGLIQSAWRSPPDWSRASPAMDLVYRHRDRLGPRDLARFDALVPGYPAAGTVLQNVGNFERMLARWPDDADAWFELGDRLVHYGRANEIENSVERARQAFNRALALDSTFNLPLEHLLLVAFERRDSATVRTLAPRLFALGATGDRTSFARWRVGIELADTAAVLAVAAGIDTVSPGSLRSMFADAMWLGTRPEDAERIVARYRREAASVTATRDAMLFAHHLALNRGQVRRARELLDSLPVDDRSREAREQAYITDAVFWDGDAAAGAAAAARLATVPERAPASGEERSAQAQRQCVLGWWEAARGNLAAAGARRERLRRAPVKPEDYAFNTDDRTYCGALIDAWVTTARQQPGARRLLDRADSIYIASSTSLYQPGNLITARLREALGDPPGALRTIRRTFVGANDLQLEYVSTFLRETARLAARQGETELARDYYRRYLSLRARADPVLRPDLDRATAALAALAAERPK